jgi:hypothetical protein
LEGLEDDHVEAEQLPTVIVTVVAVAAPTAIPIHLPYFQNLIRFISPVVE